MSDPVVSIPNSTSSTLPNPQNQAQANNLLQGIQFNDTRLYDLLGLLIGDLYKAAEAINPTPSTVFGATGVLAQTSEVTGLVATFFNNDLRLNWDTLSGAASYEVRYKSGNNDATAWDSATSLLSTTTIQADINPITIPLVYGNHTFLVKATAANGIQSTTAAVVVISVPIISAPILSCTVIDNFVLLKWTTPSSTWAVDHFNVYKNGVLIGNLTGTFDAVFETTAGAYTYAVEAVDIVGNVGTQAALLVDVKQPPDYSLQSNFTSTLNGTKVNAQVLTGPILIAPVDTATTWSAHFSGHAWTDIQDQINAGYPIYIQPNATPSSYEEVVDFGAVYHNIISTLTWLQSTLAGSVTVTPKIATSTDNITYTGWTTGTSLFAASARYVKFHFDFTSADDKGLVQISNVQLRLDVKREIDSGTITANAADVGGTAVTYNKTFQSIDSVTLAATSVEPIYCVYDNVTTTGFDVFALDSQGNRITYPVSWKVRGVV